tara:strand:- start:2879 stop:4117 length:1239 start_codon:yes stop_codon:yes gene_type:complete
LRITYLHQYFNTPDMSGGTRSYEMARRLVARGHEVNMVTSWRTDDGRKKPFETVEDGIRVQWLPVPYSNAMSYAQRLVAFGRFVVASTRRAAALPSDIVFATSTPLTIALPAVYAARRQRVPMVFEVRDLWPELPIAMGALRNPVAKKAACALERFAYRHSAQVIALSPGMRDGVVRAGYPAERVTVIPNSADLALFDPKMADSSAFRRKHPEIGARPLIVYTGTMGRINGVGYLVGVAQAAMQQGSKVCFAVIGSGQEEDAVRQAAAAAGVLGVNFFMFPPVAKREVPNVLASADLALSLFIDLPAMWANSANKFFDALASGTPVALNYGGWQAEWVEGTGAGLVLPPDDPCAAAQAIERWLGQPEEDKKRAGEAARALAEREFSRDVLAERLAGVLEDVARHPHRASTAQ